ITSHTLLILNRTARPDPHPLSLHDALPISRNDTYQFLSPSNDLRFLGPMILQSDHITGQPHPGVLVGVIGLAVGFGTNLLNVIRSEEHTSELQSLAYLVCRLLLENKNERIL